MQTVVLDDLWSMNETTSHIYRGHITKDARIVHKNYGAYLRMMLYGTKEWDYRNPWTSGGASGDLFIIGSCSHWKPCNWWCGTKYVRANFWTEATLRIDGLSESCISATINANGLLALLKMLAILLGNGSQAGRIEVLRNISLLLYVPPALCYICSLIHSSAIPPC
jgi:hypothetical protein